MFLFQKNLLSVLCIGSLLLYTTDGFIISFPATLSSLNPTQIIKPVIESHRSKSSIGRRPRLRAATKDSFKSSTTNSSGSSGKIQEMAFFLSIKLLETVMTESMKEDWESKVDREAIQRLTEAQQRKTASETEQATKDEFDTTASSNGVGDAIDKDRLDRSGITTKKSTSAAANTIIEKTNPEVLNKPDDTEDYRDISKVETSNESSLPSQILDPNSVSASSVEMIKCLPLEIIASDIRPLRPSSVPQRKSITEVVKVTRSEKSIVKGIEVEASDKETQKIENSNQIDTTYILERKKAEELFQRKLLKKKFELDARTRLNDNDGDSSLKDISLERKKSEELFQRKLLTKKFELDARTRLNDNDEDEDSGLKGISTDGALSLSPANVAAQDILPTSMDGATKSSKEIDTAYKLTMKKSQEMFQRRLLRKKLEFDSRVVVQKNVDSSLNGISIDEVSPTPIKVAPADQGNEEGASSTRNVISKGVHTLEESIIEGIQHSTKFSVSTPLTSLDGDDDAIEEVTKNGKESSSSTKSGSKEWAATIQERYAMAAKVSHSFITREFQPAWFATNCHFQTIIGTLFRKEAMYSRSISVLLDLVGVTTSNKGSESLLLDHFTWDKRERIKTPDGDFFDVDWSLVNSKDDNNPVCLICHGLESCSDSEIAQELAIACNDVNIDAACINFRGCSNKGAECNLTPRGYHLGFTDDLLQQITKIHSNNPNKRIYLSGFSLGAGVVTKLLADLGEDAYRYNICGAAVNAVPFDASQCSTNLNGKGITKSIYGNRLLKSMKERIKQQFDTCCDFPFERSKIDECKTIMDIENLAIAPVFGFDDAWDYYDKCKTIDILDRISVPQLIIQAKDDPFFKGLECPANNLNFPLRIQYSELGGHCGFVCQTINEDNSQISWMPTQLGRFFAHIENNFQSTTYNTEDATASLIVAK